MELIKKRLGHYRETYYLTKEKEETIEIIVPDSNPDFENTISTFSMCTLTDKSLLSGHAKITGQVNSIINYSSSASECAYTINSSAPFSDSVKIDGCSPDDVLICDVKVCSSNVEVVNSRKIKILIKLSITCSVLHLHNIDVIEDVCGEVGEGIYTLTDSCEIIPCVDISEKLISFTDEIRLSNEESLNYFRFIRWDDIWDVDDIKIMQNKVMIRGHIQINAYSTTDSSLDVISKSFILPFSQVIECKNTYEDDFISPIICCNSLNTILVQKDDTYYLNFECKASICIKSYRNMNVKYLSDIYSTKYEIRSKYNEVAFNSKIEKTNNTFILEERINISDIAVRVVDCRIIPLIVVQDDQKFYKYNITFIYCDSDGNYKTYTSELSSVTNINNCGAPCHISCEIKDIGTSIEPTGIVISFSSHIFSTDEEHLNLKIVTECSIDKNSSKSKFARGNIVLRKVLAGETVWSIAKQYCSSPNEIILANELQEIDALTEGKLIMIPFLSH